MADVTQGQWTEQELMAANVKNAEQALSVMKQLDKIKTPLEVTMYMAGNKSMYRNDAFRVWVGKMDLEQRSELEKFIRKIKQKNYENLRTNNEKSKARIQN